MLKTRYGEPIRIETDVDCETENRGWRVDRLRAIIGDAEAGYLKISHIPLANFKAFYPTIFNWLAQIRGRTYLMPVNQDAFHYQNLDEAAKRKLIGNLRRDVHYPENLKDLSGTLAAEALDPFLADLEARILEDDSVRDKFRAFYRFHVNKPMVDYIKTTHPSPIDNVPDYRRRHVGLALYRAGAFHVREQGLVLRASGLQSEEALLAWQKMCKLGWVRRESDGRSYISAHLIEAADHRAEAAADS